MRPRSQPRVLTRRYRRSTNDGTAWRQRYTTERYLLHLLFFFHHIFPHLYVESMFLTRRLHLARSCASSPDSPFSHKSTFTLSRSTSASMFLSFFFPAPPSPSLSCPPYIFFIPSHETPVPTFFPALSWIFLPLSLSV